MDRFRPSQIGRHNNKGENMKSGNNNEETGREGNSGALTKLTQQVAERIPSCLRKGVSLHLSHCRVRNHLTIKQQRITLILGISVVKAII